jgi:hypothetical protein
MVIPFLPSSPILSPKGILEKRDKKTPKVEACGALAFLTL